jgi:excisionase family DNA binding protein
MEAANTEGCAPEPFLTIQAAAALLNLPVFKLRRAARRGLFPIYRIGNGRILVRLSEVVAAIERSRRGGDR